MGIQLQHRFSSAALTALATGALCVVPAHAAPCGPSVASPQDEIAWVEASLDDALGRAFDRNVPLVVFACLADEPQNEEFRRNLAGNRVLAKLLADALPMYASNGEPPPGAPLTRHKTLMDEVYNRWVAEETPDGSWALPEVLVVHPSGEVQTRLGSGNTVKDDEVKYAVTQVVKRLGDSVTDVEVTELKRLRDSGRAATEAKQWVAAWRAWYGVLALTGDGPFAKEAKEAMPAAERELIKVLEASGQGVDEANLAERYGLLRDVARRAQGSEPEKIARRVLATIERDKRFKAPLVALRIEEEALDLLFDAEALLAKGDEPGALRILKKLAGKRYAETQGAELMRARHADRLR